MNAEMSIQCVFGHHWSEYHATEILYFAGDKRHIRMFEICQRCGMKRQVDFEPDGTEAPAVEVR